MTHYADSSSTDHFWYRLQPEGPYIDSQCGDMAFGFCEGKVFLSEDNGRTWPHASDFANAADITFSHIFRNGDVLFATSTRLFRSTDRLRSIEPVPVYDAAGREYLPHTPKNPDCPGWYFHPLTGVNSWDVHGAEMLVWGNYCNVIGGAVPVNIYYSADNGESVKIAYAFGQNPHFTDDGSPGGGPAGEPLGDPDNPVICRHVHAVTYNPMEDAFYACTGDGDRPEGFECHWLRGVYDSSADAWEWEVIVSDHLNSRYKCGGLTFIDGILYWISDSNGPEPYDRGIFRCAPENIRHPERHERLFNPGVEAGCMIIEDGVFLAGHCTPASPMDTGFIASTDGGATWAQYDLKELGARSPVRFHSRNGEGWFRVDLRAGWIEPAEVLFIKPKP